MIKMTRKSRDLVEDVPDVCLGLAEPHGEELGALGG